MPQKDPMTLPSPEYERMEAQRALPRDLRRMNELPPEQVRLHLWQHSRESRKDFLRRVLASVCEPFYWAACEHLAGQPFVRPIKWSDGTSPDLLKMAEDIDGQDRDIRTLARSSCLNSVGYGLSYLFVVWSEEDGRPYLTELPGECVLDPYVPPGGVRVLMQVPSENYDRAKPWTRKNDVQLWVLWDGEPTASGDDRFARWEVYEREDPSDPTSPFRDAPSPQLGGSFRPELYIPLFPVPSGSDTVNDRQPWVSGPPLYPLALMNRLHFNKRSDLDAGLALSNIPQRAASGLTEGEAKKIDTASHHGLWWMMNPQGKFYFVETQGSSFEISLKDLEQTERRMEVFGLSPLVSEPSGGATALGRRIDLTRAVTTAQAWSMVWQDSWLQAMRAFARYLSKPDSFTLEFVSDFGPRDGDVDKAKVVQQDYLQGDLDPRDYYPEMKRLGIYGEAFDANAAARRVLDARSESLRRLAALPSPRQPLSRVPSADDEQHPEDAGSLPAGDKSSSPAA